MVHSTGLLLHGAIQDKHRLCVNGYICWFLLREPDCCWRNWAGDCPNFFYAQVTLWNLQYKWGVEITKRKLQNGISQCLGGYHHLRRVGFEDFRWSDISDVGNRQCSNKQWKNGCRWDRTSATRDLYGRGPTGRGHYPGRNFLTFLPGCHRRAEDSSLCPRWSCFSPILWPWPWARLACSHAAVRYCGPRELVKDNDTCLEASLCMTWSMFTLQAKRLVALCASDERSLT